MASEIKKIKLNKIYFDLNNPRHDPVESESEAMQKLLLDEDIRPLAEANRRSLMRVSQAVLDSCSEPIGKDEIVKRVGALFGISMSITEFLLYSAAISAHLTWLRKNALISPFVEDGLLLWRRTP